MTISRRRFVKALATIGALSNAQSLFAKSPAPTLPLEVAVRSPWLANQVALTSQGRLFLGLPRHELAVETPSVARRESDGSLRPFPGGGWNAWQPGDDGIDAFVYINSVHIFADDTVWCVDQGILSGKGAADANAALDDRARKIVQLDAESGAVIDVLRFDPTILPQGAKLNDIRRHGSTLYVTDSGLGALIVHDQTSGKTLRRLSGMAPMLAIPGKMPAGLASRLKGREFHPPNSDFLEVTGDGEWLYWSAPTGPFYRIRTSFLKDERLDDEALLAHVEPVADITFSSGCSMDSRGNLYLSETTTGRITLLTSDRRQVTLVDDPDLMRPDGSFISHDRRLYIPVKTPPAAYADTDAPYVIYSVGLPERFEGIALGGPVG
ncbi:L-dopachrome tautomerase-related protein [Salinicola rhizosphaerae]|uniref:Gluconolactonase n=1 Tax=Salinicola rhizosphaerae TaxID=1443141 RepID=A0ABQ3DU95_9GAMM|nr:L-dopachrome tautomerase-related protein [Salinicola rhizosphaerae]GHB07614.1 hypothetical protein GCM10009038_01050 [Salinicola rhizosphaerae]